MLMGAPENLGNVASLTDFSTQPPVGVPANLPVTLADWMRPAREIVMSTLTVPGTRY